MPAAKPLPTSIPEIPAIRAQLDKILAAQSFANSGRQSRFLRFVVEQALEGRGAQLKEYLIGVEVYDRGEGYDPRVDTIVLVEASRLRLRLADSTLNNFAEMYRAEGRYSQAEKLYRQLIGTLSPDDPTRGTLGAYSRTAASLQDGDPAQSRVSGSPLSRCHIKFPKPAAKQAMMPA